MYLYVHNKIGMVVQFISDLISNVYHNIENNLQKPRQ